MKKVHTSPRRSAAEWSKLVAAWSRSGKTATEFAASRGVSATTLTWWKWRLSKQAGRGEPVKLVRLDVVPDAAGREGLEWELRTARGHVLRASGADAAEALAVVVDALALAEESC